MRELWIGSPPCRRGLVLRHAAALALVGWYLMIPAKASDPISRWYQGESFDTAAQCANFLNWQMSDDYAKQAKGTPSQIQEYRRALKDAKCISSDDPRLKEK